MLINHNGMISGREAWAGTLLPCSRGHDRITLDSGMHDLPGRVLLHPPGYSMPSDLHLLPLQKPASSQTYSHNNCLYMYTWFYTWESYVILARWWTYLNCGFWTTFDSTLKECVSYATMGLLCLGKIYERCNIHLRAHMILAIPLYLPANVGKVKLIWWMSSSWAINQDAFAKRTLGFWLL